MCGAALVDRPMHRPDHASMLVTAAPDQGQLIDWSLTGRVAMIFPRSRAANFPAALAIARQASQYAEHPISGVPHHWAGFGRSREQVARAIALINLVRGIKGFQVFAGGVRADWARVLRVLECYLQSCSCTDWRAHCHVVVDGHRLESPGGGVRDTLPSQIVTHSLRPAPGDGLSWAASAERETFPCRYLLQRHFHYQPGHPAERGAQVQAAAVREGCAWCPNLNA
jgi:hypothetical protein